MLTDFISPCLKRVQAPEREKSAIKERESRAVTEAGFVILRKRLFLDATPTPAIWRLYEEPGIAISPTPNIEYGVKLPWVPPSARSPVETVSAAIQTIILTIAFLDIIVRDYSQSHQNQIINCKDGIFHPFGKIICVSARKNYNVIGKTGHISFNFKHYA